MASLKEVKDVILMSESSLFVVFIFNVSWAVSSANLTNDGASRHRPLLGFKLVW